MQISVGEVMHGVGHQLVDLLYIVDTSWVAVAGAVGYGGRVG